MNVDQVLRKTRDKIRLKHFALNTEDAYCGWIRRYSVFCLQLPKGLTPEQKAEAFLTDLAKRLHVAARTQNQALASLLFLYKYVLERPLLEVNAMRARRGQYERVAPSRDQIRQIRELVGRASGVLYLLIIDLLYGCGLRVSEPLELRIKDIDWERRQLVIRAAKGNKDRRVPIPTSCIQPLQQQVAAAKRIWEWDRQHAPKVGVVLPQALNRKFSTAVFSWNWFWLFPAASHCRDPRSGQSVRHHLLHDQVQRAVRQAALRLNLEGIVTPHALRHAYATHSKESIETLRKLMGHVSIETTAGYRHPDVDSASNPLDDLLSPAPNLTLH